MDRQAMRETLSNLFDEVRLTGDDLSENIAKLNEYYSDIKLYEKDRVKLFTDDYYTFLDIWEEITENLHNLLTAAHNVNENLLEALEPQNDSNDSSAQIILDAAGGTTDDIEYIGRIVGDDCDLKFTVVTDHSKMNTEEGMVKAIRIFDSDSRDLLNYQKPGTFKVIPDNNAELVEYFIKLLRKFDTKIQQEE